MSSAGDTLRLMTYNVHGCIGRDRVEDSERVLEVIRAADADVIALQEVYDLDTEDRNFLRGLERLGYASLIYGPTMLKAIGPYGNILMSRRSPIQFDKVDLSLEGVEPRGAIRALLPFAGGQISICVTHLGLSAKERKVQLSQLLEGFSPTSGNLGETPCVLMGDLNEWWPWSRNLFAINQRFEDISKLMTFPVRLPLFALDRICVQNFRGQIKYSRPKSELARAASDHRPLIADLSTE